MESQHDGHIDWTRHAPPGGISINGKHYGGGRFIPNEELERASPSEIEELNRKTELYNAYETKEEGPPQAAPGEEILPENQIDLVPEAVFIIDDGKILGGEWGEFILKKNVTQDIFLDKKEVDILNVLKTKRLDIISPEKQEVYSIFSTGIWPDTDTLEQIKDNINTIPLAEYTLLNNLSPKIKEVLLTNGLPTEAASPPPEDKEGSEGPSEPVDHSHEKHVKPVKPVPEVKPVKMSLFRLSKIKDNTWNVETEEGKPGVLKVMAEKEKRKIKFIYNIYKCFEIPIECLQECEEGFVSFGDKEKQETPSESEEGKQENKQENKMVAAGDHNQGNKSVLNKILGIKEAKSIDQIDFIDPMVEALTPEEEKSDILNKITPDLIDKLLSDCNFTKEELLDIKNKILQNVDKPKIDKIIKKEKNK